MKQIILPFIVALCLSAPSLANDDLEFDSGGELNPHEMSISKTLKKAARGEVGMVICSQGYALVKKADHKEARALFEACAKKGWTGTMTWLSYMEQNGHGGAENPQAAAEWDRKAAELGDPIGMFNHGLDLLRGYGVKQNTELGKSYIDKSAVLGFKDAKTLQAGDYDPEIVTPDADSWKYEKRLY